MSDLAVNSIVCGDCLEVMREWPAQSVDLVFGSPPYEDARTYGMEFRLTGQDWVDWMVPIVQESLRVCRGLVAFVVAGRTRKFRWSATPALLMADLHRAGVCLRNPPIFSRVGICGSGGPDWLRSDYEFVVCATNGGKLPWSNNTAMGHPPKYAPGGEMSHRLSSGARANQWGHSINSGETVTLDGGKVRSCGKRPSHVIVKKFPAEKRPYTKRRINGEMEIQQYVPPVIANPGNIIHCLVGGGVMGSRLVHENEAGFPERLAEFFIQSFCPPGGIVVDPFSGSGTTAAVAIKTGRKYIAIDCRESQVDLTRRRIAEARNGQKGLFE